MKIIFISLVFSFAFVSCSRPTIKTGLEGQTMPAFQILSKDSNAVFSSADFPKEKPIVLFYFSPQCPFCRAQMDDMMENMDVLKGVQIYMMTNFSFTEMREFYAEYRLKSYPNIMMGNDMQFFFAKYFKASGVPFTAIYGKDRKLKGVYVGPAETRDILALLNE